jgi:voltage-gated sodium channel
MIIAAPDSGPRIGHVFVSERVIMTMIVINSLALFCMGFSETESIWWRICFYVDYLCLTYFLVEAVYKIRVLSFPVYWASNWNKFDLTIVLISLPALLSPFLDLHGFSAILIVRMGRLFRLFRLLKFIPNIEHLIAGLSRSLKASIGIILGLFIINLIFALGATFLFQEFAPEHFDHPLKSLYSLFKIFTMEGWYEIPDLIAERSSNMWAFFSRVYFILAVMIGGILGLSLANAVLVDEMTSDNNKDLENKIHSLQMELREMSALLSVLIEKNGK